ncbi:MAG: division/cell wall cluster transcriptional repressor MraZ [Vallitaleaceae bacterium]|jgi:MraZ protein|nr:division/cell wall cluster transcriptional repressor MraZ [Vallitaleaceae bacterium]
MRLSGAEWLLGGDLVDVVKKSGEVMFSGEYTPKLDDKGRVIVPIKLREALGFTFFVTKGLDGCLFMYNEEGWTKFAQNIIDANGKDEDVRAIQRYFLSPASPNSLDKQGRFLINQNLREFAKLDKDIVMIGVVNRVEIWDAETYLKRQISANDAGNLLKNMDIRI